VGVAYSRNKLVLSARLRNLNLISQFSICDIFRDIRVYIYDFFRSPQSQVEEIQKHVGKLIKDNIVEPSVSEYNRQLLLVPKKALKGLNEKKWRLVVDYRQINKKLLSDKFPLLTIDSILDQLCRAKYFSGLDSVSGLHKIVIEENSRDIMLLLLLCFGLNSFQRMMTNEFSGIEAF